MGRSLVIFLLVTVISSTILCLLLLHRSSAPDTSLTEIAQELLTPQAFLTFKDWRLHTEPLPRGYKVVCNSDAHMLIGSDATLPWYIFHKAAGELEIRTIGSDGRVVDGPGKYVHADGSIEDCEFQGTQCFGKGRVQNVSEGWLYEGDLHDGWKDGFGTLIGLSGRTILSPLAYQYTGELQLDKFHGYGTFVSENMTYFGQFCNGQITGFGQMTHQGRTLIGQFDGGRLSGFGCEQDQLFVTCGVFRDGVRNGKAVRMDAESLAEAKYLSFKDGVETWW